MKFDELWKKAERDGVIEWDTSASEEGEYVLTGTDRVAVLSDLCRHYNIPVEDVVVEKAD